MLLLIITLLCACTSDEEKAKSTVEKYFNAISQNDEKTAYELYPNSNPHNYGIFVKLRETVYKNPKITAVKVKQDTYEVDFVPASCMYVKKNDKGDFIITDSRNVFDVQHSELSSKYNIATETGAINMASTDIQILKVEKQIIEGSDFFNFLTNKYKKYYYGDFKVLSTKKEQFNKVVFVKVTYQTSTNARRHAVVVTGKGKDGNIISTKQKIIEWLDAGNINSVSILFNGDMVDYIKDYDVQVGLIADEDPVYRLENCGAPFSKSDYKEFKKSK